jgi:hypothetical protein
MYNMFSNIYFLSQLCSKIMNLIHKTKFSMQTCFLVCGCLTFKVKMFHWGRYDRQMKEWLVL